jgi:transcription initiation factor IIE alpha subunit
MTMDAETNPTTNQNAATSGTCEAPCSARWAVELNCDCPKCGEYVNLLDAPDFWDGRTLDIPEHGTENSNNLEVVCPECGHEFKVCCQW